MRRLLVCALLLAAACRGGTDTTITVFAASSLQKAFTAEGKAFESSHPGVHVRFSFAGSQALVAQVRQGAPADVLATADLETIEQVRAQFTGEPTVFAHNQLAIVTPPGNPKALRTLTDLTRVRVVLAGPTVPLGKATDRALEAAGVTVRPVSREDSAGGVVTKVRLGEADAAVAYKTDLGSGVDGVVVPGTATSLAIGAIDTSTEARAFVAFVRSGTGAKILEDAGFTT